MTRPTPRLAGLIAASLVGVFFVVRVGGPNGILHAPGSAYTDLLITHWPNAYLFQQSVWQDHCWPLWNPSVFSGTPFAANPLSGVWYPLNWVFLVLPITPAFNLLLLAHLMLGAAGAAHLVSRLRAGSSDSWVGPLIGGLAWGLAPKTWGSLGAGHVSTVYALGWLPWIAEAAVEQLESREPAIRLRLPVLWALQFIADPRIAAYTALMLAGLVGWHLARQLMALPSLGGAQKRSVRSLFLAWALVAVLAIGLSAVQWLPLADFLPQTSRAELTIQESAVYSLPISRLLGILWPDRGGFHEWMTYFGIGVLWLAVVGWFVRSRQARWGVGVACFLLAILSLGTNGPLYPLLVRLPGASLLRVPPRVWYLVALCVSVLAGIGADALAAGGEQLVKRGRNLARITVGLTAFDIMLGLSAWLAVRDSAIRTAALWSAVWLAAAGVVLLSTLKGRAGPFQRGVILALIVAVDLVWLDSSLVERISVQTAFADDIEVASRLAKEGGRVYAPSFQPSPHIAAQAGLRIVNGVDPLQLADYAQFLKAATGIRGQGAEGYSVALPPIPDDADPLTALAQDEPDPILLSILDVRAIVSQFTLDTSFQRSVSQETGDDLNIYLNELVIPWPVVFKRVEVASDLDTVLEGIKKHGLDAMAFVRGGYPLDGPAGYERAVLLSSTPDRLLIEAAGPGLLVVSEVASPGWRARVDGQDAVIHPTDGILRGVYLAAGDHTVEMSYRPPGVFWGLGVSIVSLGGLLLAYRRRRSAHE